MNSHESRPHAFPHISTHVISDFKYCDKNKAKQCAVSVRSTLLLSESLSVFLLHSFLIQPPHSILSYGRRALKRKLGEWRRYTILKIGAKCDCILVQVGWVRITRNNVIPRLRSHFLCVVLKTGFTLFLLNNFY